MTVTRRTKSLLSGAATALLTATSIVGMGSAANAVEPNATASTMQERIDEVLAEQPGSTQTSWNEVVWDNGDVTLTLASEGISTFAVGSCATGKFCAYSGTFLSGSRLTFSSCGTHSTTSIGTVRSIANARSSGSVQGKNSANTVLVTVGAGSSNGSTPIGVTKVSC